MAGKLLVSVIKKGVVKMIKDKIVFLLIGVSCLVVLSLSGCGQGGGGSTGGALSTSQNGSGYVIKGVVHDFYKGRGSPIVGAKVNLSGVTNETTAASDGSYIFAGVPFGSYTVTAVKDGYRIGSGNGQFASPVEGSILTIDIPLNDKPTVTSIYPQNGSTISPSTTAFTISFNESMNPDTVAPTLNFASMKATGISAQGVMSITKSWDAEYKNLTVSIGDTLVAGATYTFSIASSALDNSGNLLDWDATYSTTFYTASNITQAPDKPTGMRAIALTYYGTSEVDFNNVNYCYNSVKLEWEPANGAAGYRLYASYNGGAYQQVGSDYSSFDNIIYKTNFDLTPAMVDAALAEYSRNGDIYPSDPGLPWPFLGSGINIKVSAVNPIGETMSDAILVKDKVSPRINYANVYSSNTKQVVIGFNEPLEQMSAGALNNYIVKDSNGNIISVENAVYTVSYQNGYTLSNATLTLSSGITGGTIESALALQDISGNALDPAGSKATIYYHTY